MSISWIANASRKVLYTRVVWPRSLSSGLFSTVGWRLWVSFSSGPLIGLVRRLFIIVFFILFPFVRRRETFLPPFQFLFLATFQGWTWKIVVSFIGSGNLVRTLFNTHVSLQGMVTFVVKEGTMLVSEFVDVVLEWVLLAKSYWFETKCSLRFLPVSRVIHITCVRLPPR